MQMFTDAAGLLLAPATPQQRERPMEMHPAHPEVWDPYAQFVPLAALALEGSASELPASLIKHRNGPLKRSIGPLCRMPHKRGKRLESVSAQCTISLCRPNSSADIWFKPSKEEFDVEHMHDLK